MASRFYVGPTSNLAEAVWPPTSSVDMVLTTDTPVSEMLLKAVNKIPKLRTVKLSLDKGVDCYGGKKVMDDIVMNFVSQVSVKNLKIDSRTNKKKCKRCKLFTTEDCYDTTVCWNRVIAGHSGMHLTLYGGYIADSYLKDISSAIDSLSLHSTYVIDNHEMDDIPKNVTLHNVSMVPGSRAEDRFGDRVETCNC